MENFKAFRFYGSVFLEVFVERNRLAMDVCCLFYLGTFISDTFITTLDTTTTQKLTNPACNELVDEMTKTGEKSTLWSTHLLPAFNGNKKDNNFGLLDDQLQPEIS